MIRLSSVSKRYAGGQEALRNVSIEISKGEFLLLTGHSGAGKSTLLKIMAAIERPSAGQIWVGGQNLAGLRAAAIPYLRRNLGLVFQDHKLLFDRSVYDNVALPLRITAFETRDISRRVRAALDRVGLLGRERANPVALSGGEQQRVCIARAIVHRPAIVLADEPTANLDDAYAREIVTLFQALHQVGVTLLVSTHSAAFFDDVSPRVVELQNGALVS
ncbi:MAG: cell division ATP-binding protein FtsE [Betaproteobacteria bacterium]|nr:cell division ATP-binding protein FtsE [Betaproteobacteria bacterium]